MFAGFVAILRTGAPSVTNTSGNCDPLLPSGDRPVVPVKKKKKKKFSVRVIVFCYSVRNVTIPIESLVGFSRKRDCFRAS